MLTPQNVGWQLCGEGKTTAPTANDDSDDGFSAGSRWFDTTNNKEYVCMDASVAAAVWVETTVANQTGAQIKSAYEGEADTNAFTDADHSKLDGIETAATADQTAGEIESIVSHDNLLDFLADEHVNITAGVAASRPAAGTANRYYFATDTKVLSRDNGTTWDDHASGGGSALTVEDEGTPLTTGATKFNFAGAGVTVTEPVTDEMLVTIPGGASALGAVTARRTTTYTLTNAFADITLDATDVESAATVVKHDDTNTEQIDILETGTYLLSYVVCCATADTTERVFSTRLIKNGTTEIPGTKISHAVDEPTNAATPVLFSICLAVDLTAGDEISLQGMVDVGSGLTYEAGLTLTAVKLEGVAGPTGPTGADGDITWQGAWATSTAYTTNQAVENDGSSYVCISNHTSSAGDEPGVGGSWATYWELLASKGDAGSGRIETIPIFMHNGYEKSEVSATYVTQARHLFRGSTEVGTPASVKAILNVNAGTGGACRIYDLTNSLVIAEVTGLANTTAAVTDLGTISNVPAGAAVWEIQIKNDGANATAISNVSIGY